jgi:hypothetical protein
MSTWIKAGFWQQLCNDCKGYKGWLNLTEFVKSIAQLYPGPQGPVGPMGSLTDAYHGSFYSLLDQQATLPNVTQAVVFEQTALSNGVTVTVDENNYLSKITFQYAGVYNIDFSAQLHNTGGGGSGESIFIWFRKNGIDISSSNTNLTLPNGRFVVASWNIFVSVANGDYVQLVGYPDNTSIVLEHLEGTLTQPAVPSMILTVNRIA